MDVFEEESSGRAEIPGLPDSERGNKKGKKKGNNTKKTLSLQNFLQDENQEPAHEPADSGLDAHFAKLNLDSEELIVMESCHSYIHDFLRQMGPTHAMDPVLQQEINNFPPEAKRIIQKCGGYRNFILRSKDLAVVDKIVAAKSDLRNAQDMAFKEIYNNLPTSTSHQLSSKNDNISSEGRGKEIWNSKSNLNKPMTNIWDPRGNEKPQDQFQLEIPRVDSLFNDGKGSQCVYYQSNPTSTSNLNQDEEFSKSSRGHPAQHNYTVQQNLLKGLGHQDPFQSAESKQSSAVAPTFPYSQGNQLEELKREVWKLTEENQALHQRVTERDQLHEELKSLQAKFISLESVQHNTKNDYMMAKAELEQVKAELDRVRKENPSFNLQDDGVGGSPQDVIFSLRKSLETVQLQNLTLSQELEKQKSEQSRFFSPSSLSSTWNTGLPSSSLANTDTDMLGLRSMMPGPWSGDAVTSQSAPAPSLLPPPVSQGSNFLSGGHRAHEMFSGLSLGSTHQDFQPILPRSSTSSSLGLHLLADPTPHLPPPSPQLGAPPPGGDPPLPSLPSLPSLATPGSLYTGSTQLQTPSPAVSIAAANTTGKTARQEMLVKKLVTMLPEGTSEDTIKNCIQVLRARNGKLSGWPTSKIASAISELLPQFAG